MSVFVFTLPPIVCCSRMTGASNTHSGGVHGRLRTSHGRCRQGDRTCVLQSPLQDCERRAAGHGPHSGMSLICVRRQHESCQAGYIFDVLRVLHFVPFVSFNCRFITTKTMAQWQTTRRRCAPEGTAATFTLPRCPTSTQRRPSTCILRHRHPRPLQAQVPRCLCPARWRSAVRV